MDCNRSDIVPGLDAEPELSVVAVHANATIPEQPKGHVVNWDELQIEQMQDDEGEGRIEIIDEDHLYALLGLRTEDAHAEGAADAQGEGAAEARTEGADEAHVDDVDTRGAAIPIDDEIPEERVMVYDPKKPCMDIGTVYPNMREFRLAVRQYAINEEFALDTAKTDTERFIGKCMASGCSWHINGRKEKHGQTVRITALTAGHDCSSSARKLTTTPTAAWVASRGIEYLRKDPNMGPKALRTKLEDEHNCVIQYDTICKGRNIAMEQLFGSWEESFQMLYNWRAEVLKHSPNSVIEIDIREVDGKVHFHRFFCALGPCIEGFLEGCRPYLAIDSTALNGRWGGHLAAATAIDGHNWMYPVAFGFIDGETIENWEWFMTYLHKAICDLPVLAICTDACKGLEKAVKTVFPQAEHRECFRHLMQNFIKKFGGDVFSKMYPAARAYRDEVFQHFFNSVREASNEVREWLQKHHNLLWMRSAFNPEIKCDYITNNLAECFNNWIKDWKDLPVVELADKIREMLMVLWRKRRQIGQRLNGRILPAIIRHLKMRTRGLGHLTVITSDSFAAEIWDLNTIHNRHVVKTYIRECTCLEWQHTGKPCQHALALITAQHSVDVDLEQFVHEYYSVEKFKNAYKRLIPPLPDKTQWPHVQLPWTVQAPLDKKTQGRYRKLRIKGCLEGGSGGKGKKAAKEAANEADKVAEEEAMQAGKPKRQLIRGKRKCKRCGELGHGETSYKCHLNGTKKRKRKPRTNTTKYGKDGNTKSKKAPENNPVQSENAAVQTEKDVVHAENAAVQQENAAANTPVKAQDVVSQAENVVTAKENILATTPDRVTRSRLAFLLGEGPSTSTPHLAPKKQATTSPKPRKRATDSPKKGVAKKLVPKRLKTN